MKSLYSAKCTSTGGRIGRVESDDGNLSVDLTMPKRLGGTGQTGTTNPEQLFAAAYAACFDTAIRQAAKQHNINIPGLTVEVEVGLVAMGSGFGLVVGIHPVFTGLDGPTRNELVAQAHKTCTYSNAIRGNVEVKFTVNGVAFAPKADKR